jgi:plastocyanin
MPLVVLVAALLWQGTHSSAQLLEPAELASQTGRPTTMVTIFDNDAPSPAPPQNVFDPEQSFWGFGPHSVLVQQGDLVVFVNPSTNKHAHTVTSLERIGPPFPTPPCTAGTIVGSDACRAVVAAGSLFDSSPTAPIQPGGQFILDTLQPAHGRPALPPGNYAYFCKLHPWMVAEVTVTDRGLH